MCGVPNKEIRYSYEDLVLAAGSVSSGAAKPAKKHEPLEGEYCHECKNFCHKAEKNITVAEVGLCFVCYSCRDTYRWKYG